MSASKREKEALVEVLWGNSSIGLSGWYGSAAGLISRAVADKMTVVSTVQVSRTTARVDVAAKSW